METLIIQIKNKKDSRLIKELLSRLDVEVADKDKLRNALPQSKFKSKKEFLSFAGSMKGQLISKENLHNLSWKKREW
jgi:hypothetical protein